MLKVPVLISLENEFSLKLADMVTFPASLSSKVERNCKIMSHLRAINANQFMLLILLYNVATVITFY